MKKIGLLLIASLLSFQVSAADVQFTWNKPVPAFSETPPAGWLIDEYRVYCSVDDGNGTITDFNTTAFGYDTESILATGIAAGIYTCYVTSYSALPNLESVQSNTITKTISSTAVPGEPTNFDFIDQNPTPPGQGSSWDKRQDWKHKDKNNKPSNKFKDRLNRG